MFFDSPVKEGAGHEYSREHTGCDAPEKRYGKSFDRACSGLHQYYSR